MPEVNLLRQRVAVLEAGIKLAKQALIERDGRNLLPAGDRISMANVHLNKALDGDTMALDAYVAEAVRTVRPDNGFA